MKYAYEDLSDDQFETLVVILCQSLLGMGVQGFAKGPDGGRDAKFIGTAELIPSKRDPWSGTTIVQAKHTNGHNRGFLESDFYSRTSSKTVLGEEIPRIKKLRANGHCDNYMLFSNRRLSGNAESEIRTHISISAGIPEMSVCLCGVEQLELWLKQFPHVALIADLDPIDSPLIVSPDELAEIVQALEGQKDLIEGAFTAPQARVTYEEKNKANNMTESYARAQRKKYLKDTSQIGAFLAAPENAELLRRYEAATEELELKIIAHRKDYQTFDNVMEYLIDLLLGRDPILRGNKRLTRSILFYMYWHCDIGDITDA